MAGGMAAVSVMAVVACGPLAVRIVIAIATEVAVEVGKEFVRRLVDANFGPGGPVLTIRHVDASDQPAIVRYQVDKAQSIDVRALEGTVTISSVGCNVTIVTEPGTTAKVEIRGDSDRACGEPLESCPARSGFDPCRLKIGMCYIRVGSGSDLPFQIVDCSTPGARKVVAVFRSTEVGPEGVKIPPDGNYLDQGNELFAALCGTASDTWFIYDFKTDIGGDRFFCAKTLS
jgi:hypothetical protein